jgi:hypothetical protein
MTRAATSHDTPDDDPGLVLLCVHALDNDDLPRCRGVKREHLTDVDLPWEKWPASLLCEECVRRAET